MHPFSRLFPLAAGIVAAAACHGRGTLAPLPAGGIHVLFIGNSLTYEWDLPGTVATVALLAGDTVRVASQTGPSLALIDHFNGATDAVAAIRADRWDFVVLQQGPTPVGICRDSLVLTTQLFDPVIRAQGARTAVFQTWPLAGPVWYTNIGESFRVAADAVHGTLLPVGDAWFRVLDQAPSTALYQPDRLHPTGTYLSALVIYEVVTGHDARLLPARAVADGQDLNLPAETVRLFQQAAHDAVAGVVPAAKRTAPPGQQPPAAQVTSC
jgi:hypothetical protein